MSVAATPAVSAQIDWRLAAAVREGLTSVPRRLPPWLFYDETGSRLFDAITQLNEYYLTRTEGAILRENAKAIVAEAAGTMRLRIAELGAGSAQKTQILLKTAVDRQATVIYEPIDVSATALDGARERIEREIPGVAVLPRVMDYTHGKRLEMPRRGERRLVLYIGSSLGNFEADEAERLLRRVRASLDPGDGLLLGIDLVKDESILLPAYDDADGVTAAFNRNLLARLNRELGADFDLNGFAHRALWNPRQSRMEMHLESCGAQRVQVGALGMAIDFADGETIHTENSYKYRSGQAEAMMAQAGFTPAGYWTDSLGWFAVNLGRAK